MRFCEPAIEGCILKDLDRLYHTRFSYAENCAREGVWRVLCQHFLQRWVAHEASVLDLGCGFEKFTRHIKAGCKVAVDVNEHVAARFGRAAGTGSGGSFSKPRWCAWVIVSPRTTLDSS